MACITSSIDLLYLLKIYWCGCIIFIEGNLITSKIFNLTGCCRNSKKLCSSAPTEHFAGDIGAVKWYLYNVEAKVISFVK